MYLRFDKQRRKKRYLFMAEPKVSHKHLEEPTPCFEARKQHLVVSVLLTLLFLMASVDAISATSPTVDHRDGLIRIRRDPTMPNDRSMSAADVNDKGTEDSSRHSSLPLSVDVASDDNDEIHVGLLSSCSADEYLDKSNTCQKCVTCGPGTQHKINKECGYGRGENQTCEPCNPGVTYQDKTSSILVRCKPCITCDKLANTTRECSPEHNAECGPCQPGFYYFQENNCVSCKQDRTREECRMTTPITPEPTESTSVPPPVVSDATPSPPADIVNATNQTGTTSKGGVDQAVLAGVIVGGVLGVLVIAALIGLICAILKKKGGETGARVENGTTGGLPGSRNVVTVRYNRAGETIQYDGICQVDESDEPHSLHSNLPVGPSTVSPSSGCGPAVLAPPDGLPREGALPLSGDMAALPQP